MGMDIKIEGIPQIRRNMMMLGGRGVVPIARQSLRAGLRPVVQQAKRNVPVRSGNLKASLGVYMAKKSYRGLVRAKVWPRDKFNRTTRGQKSSFSISASRKGHPLTYATLVESGYGPRPGSSFMSRAFQTKKGLVLGVVAEKMFELTAKKLKAGISPRRR